MSDEKFAEYVSQNAYLMLMFATIIGGFHISASKMILRYDSFSVLLSCFLYKVPSFFVFTLIGVGVALYNGGNGVLVSSVLLWGGAALFDSEYYFVSSSKVIVYVLVNIFSYFFTYLLLYFDGYSDAVLYYSLSPFICSIVLSTYLCFSLSNDKSKVYWNEYFNGWRLFSSTLNGTIMQRLPLIVVSYLFSPSVVSYYALCEKILEISRFLSNTINRVYFFYIERNATVVSEYMRLIWRLMALYFSALVLSIFILPAFGWLFSDLKIVYVFLFLSFFASVSNLLGVCFYLSFSKEKLLFKINIYFLFLYMAFMAIFLFYYKGQDIMSFMYVLFLFEFLFFLFRLFFCIKEVKSVA